MYVIWIQQQFTDQHSKPSYTQYLGIQLALQHLILQENTPTIPILNPNSSYYTRSVLDP